MFLGRMVLCVGFHFVKGASRAFSTSPVRHVRFRTHTPELVEVGHFLPKEIDKPYPAGQLFLHRAFAYRGIIMFHFNCKVSTLNNDSHLKPAGKTVSKENLPKLTVTSPYYQVLIHRDDWDTMSFSYDMTAYLAPAVNRTGKVMTVINGMDCVAHEDIIPYTLPDDYDYSKPAIRHDLFTQLFQPSELEAIDYEMCGKTSFQQLNQWLYPQSIQREVTEGIEVQVITFYLGTNNTKGHTVHVWRYVMRLRNMDPTRTVVVRQRELRMYNLSNTTHHTGENMNGLQPRLTPQYPTFQFSTQTELSNEKGGYVWGKLKMEREDGTTFDVPIPTFKLECTTEMTAESIGNGTKS